jgi:hypothetical protein
MYRVKELLKPGARDDGSCWLCETSKARLARGHEKAMEPARRIGAAIAEHQKAIAHRQSLETSAPWRFF